MLAAGDGALGFSKALRGVFLETAEQRCWWTRSARCWPALTTSAHPGAKRALAEIYNADNKTLAIKAAYGFAEAYGAKWARAKRQFQGPRERHDGLVERRMQILISRHSALAYRARSRLSRMCDAWADEFEQKTAAGQSRLDAGLAREGIALFRALPATGDRDLLLCTDLHAENVLAAEREPWLVIDPKPYVGDPTYDVLQHLLNCDDRLRVDPRNLAWRMADLLGLDRGTAFFSGSSLAACRSHPIGLVLLRSPAASLLPNRRSDTGSDRAVSGWLHGGRPTRGS